MSDRRRAGIEEVDLARVGLRELNLRLHALAARARARGWRIRNPGGEHALAAGSTPTSRSTSTVTSATTAPA